MFELRAWQVCLRLRSESLSTQRVPCPISFESLARAGREGLARPALVGHSARMLRETT